MGLWRQFAPVTAAFARRPHGEPGLRNAVPTPRTLGFALHDELARAEPQAIARP